MLGARPDAWLNAPNKISKTTPCTVAVKGRRSPPMFRKPFDASGKSPAQWHHGCRWIGLDVGSISARYSPIDASWKDARELTARDAPESGRIILILGFVEFDPTADIEAAQRTTQRSNHPSGTSAKRIPS